MQLFFGGIYSLMIQASSQFPLNLNGSKIDRSIPCLSVKLTREAYCISLACCLFMQLWLCRSQHVPVDLDVSCKLDLGQIITQSHSILIAWVGRKICSAEHLSRVPCRSGFQSTIHTSHTQEVWWSFLWIGAELLILTMLPICPLWRAPPPPMSHPSPLRDLTTNQCRRGCSQIQGYQNKIGESIGRHAGHPFYRNLMSVGFFSCPYADQCGTT